MNKPATIIVLDRDEITLQLITLQFSKAGFTGDLLMFTEFRGAIAYIENRFPTIFISDFFLNKFDHFKSLLKIQQLATLQQHGIKMIIMGEFISDKEEIPAEIINVDFVVKPLGLDIIEKWVKSCN